MAGLTGRMSTVIKAKVSKLLDRAEDPAETLDYSYQKQVEQAAERQERAIADVVTAKKRLQMQESSLQAERRKARHAGRQAVSAGRRTWQGWRSSARTWRRRSSSRSTGRSQNSKSSSRGSPTQSRSCA